MKISPHVTRFDGSGSGPQPDPILRILSYDEMVALPEPGFLVKGLLMRSTSALLFGPSNSFKSFLAGDIGCCVATGRTWHGQEVTDPGPVLYIATEGGLGLAKQRIPGWMEAHGIAAELRNQFYLYPEEIALDNDAAVDTLLRSCAAKRGQPSPAKAFRLVIVDIFGASMMGPETSDETARAWVRNVNRIMREMGCTVLTVAHTGWGDQTRARMHSHFWGSFDSRFKVEGDKDKRTTTLTVDRHKDADSTGRWAFQLDETTLPDGKTTLVPRVSEWVDAARRRRVSGKPAIALQALKEALADHGQVMPPPNYPSCRVVHVDQWGEMCRRHSLTDSDSMEARKKAFQRAKEKLMEDGFVRQFDSHVWMTDADV